MAAPANKSSIRAIALNRKASRDYFIIDRMEAGIELRGTEVKSVRSGAVGLAGSYAMVEHDELILYDTSISTYEYGNRFNHDPLRPRRLLMHRQEIRRLRNQVEQKGYSLIPLSVYLRKGRVKIEMGICKGKREYDKRETLRRRTADEEAARAVARVRGS